MKAAKGRTGEARHRLAPRVVSEGHGCERIRAEGDASVAEFGGALEPRRMVGKEHARAEDGKNSQSRKRKAQLKRKWKSLLQPESIAKMKSLCLRNPSKCWWKTNRRVSRHSRQPNRRRSKRHSRLALRKQRNATLVLLIGRPSPFNLT